MSFRDGKLRGHLAKLIVDADYDGIAAWLSKCLHVEIDDETLKKAVGDMDINDPANQYSDEDSIRTWFRNRLDKTGVFDGKKDANSFIREMTTAILHVFFISVEETEEHLARLRGEIPQTTGTVAVSKIGKTTKIIHPIDRTANNVAPEPKER